MHPADPEHAPGRSGDFIDRGEHQLEVAVLLFALKALYPERIFLLRGNHEFREQNVAMGLSGFVCECRVRFASLPAASWVSCSSNGSSGSSGSGCGGSSGGSGGGSSSTQCAGSDAQDVSAEIEEAGSSSEAAGSPSDPQSTSTGAPSASRTRPGWVVVFEAIHSAFDWLPIGGLVASTVLVLHGGIGDGGWGLEQLAHEVPRPLKTLKGVPSFVAQALWSDPSDSDAEMAKGVHHNVARDPHLRDAGMKRFGPDVTEAFCKREGLQLIVRSHQFVADGVKFMHSGRLVTVFSARNCRPPHCCTLSHAHLNTRLVACCLLLAPTCLLALICPTIFMPADVRAARNDAALLLIAMDGHGNWRLRAKRLLHAPDAKH